ncbi:MAG: D-glycero-beta-D-manno-heptose 1-phosphate adenylyltransferase, partial [Acetatifactor sp.]|nr:D-glycero-beta-D-manno-heptose 1-phosphate adenylyltransferase [Acetatifactor sp.]
VFLEGGNVKHSPGGAANVAVNLAAIGIHTCLIAVVGNDLNGEILKNRLEESGVDISTLVTSDDYSTISKLRYIGPGNQQLLRVDTEEVKQMTVAYLSEIFDLIENQKDQIGLLVLSDYMKGVLSEEVVQEFISFGKDNDVPVVIDVKDRNIKKYKGANLLKPNRKELAELTGYSTDTIEEAIDAAMMLCREASCGYVLATLGADGMILVDAKGLIRQISSVAKEVYDVTGAGDTTIAYLAAEMFYGGSVDDAMTVANYAAGLQVSRVGTSIVYPREVREYMAREEGYFGKNILNYYEPDGIKDIEKLRDAGKKIVFTNGCFDILHAGHVSYLKKAKTLGDVLVVGVNSDASVKRIKGEKRPINTLQDRESVLEALEAVDFVIAFEEDTPEKLIKAIKPDVLVKGGDYSIDTIVGADEVIKSGGRVEVLPFVEGRSTSGIIETINKL